MVDRNSLMPLLCSCLRAWSIQAKSKHVDIKLLLYTYLLTNIFLSYIICLYIVSKYWENNGEGWVKNYPFRRNVMSSCTKWIVAFNNFFTEMQGTRIQFKQYPFDCIWAKSSSKFIEVCIATNDDITNFWEKCGYNLVQQSVRNVCAKFKIDCVSCFCARAHQVFTS